MEQEQEDKKCRICGYADTKNVNIFTGTHFKTLLPKILTVYPIVLYENDPLPKNICKKCIYNVSFMYNDMQRVLKNQNKWIKNVRYIQPNHNYIRVLDLIEHTSSVTKESIKATLGEDLDGRSIHRMLLLQQNDAVEDTNNTKCTPSPENKKSQNLLNKAGSSSSHLPVLSLADKAVPPSKQQKSPEIKDIKSILELNGCTLLTVGAKKSQNLSNTNNHTTIATINEPVTPTIKEEPTEEDFIASTSFASSDKINLLEYAVPPPPLTVKCRYCPLQFNTLSLLASHQLVHMRLSIPKIFEKKYLHKRTRRGRLIVVQERKCIRCLNCWRVFVDNKSILEHWSRGECDFYCHICGKEFAQAPKMLREHVPAAHGISYRSSKLHRARVSTRVFASIEQTSQEESSDFKLYQSVSEQEPLPFEEESATGSTETVKASTSKKELATMRPASQTSRATISGTQPSTSSTHKSANLSISTDSSVACHICFKIFQNFKARNSHMRKHKPSYAYGDVVLPPNAGIDVYMRAEETATSNTNHNINKNKPASSTTTINSFVNKTHGNERNNADYSIPPSTNSANTIPTFTIVRGVRTKFVNRRNDLPTNATTAIKVKSMSDLQHKSTTTTAAASYEPNTNENPNSSKTWASPQHSTYTVTVVKEEPMDNDLSLNASSSNAISSADSALNVFTCISCGDQFSTKLDLFRHKRHCRANHLISCEYCGKSFISNNDYNLHMQQIHNTSG